MARRRNNDKPLEPYWHNEDISLIYIIEFNKEEVKPGTLLKIKHERSIFRFIRLVVNAETGKEWIDVFDVTLGGWRSFYVERIAGLHYAKKSRAKKVSV